MSATTSKPFCERLLYRKGSGEEQTNSSPFIDSLTTRAILSSYRLTCALPPALRCTVLLQLLTNPAFFLPAFGLQCATCERWQREHKIEIVICRDTIESFDIAASAAMNEYEFPIGALKATN